MVSQSCYTVLVVEDSPKDRALYSCYLNQAIPQPYQVLEAETVGEALELCGNIQPDLILLAYQLPNENGLVFLRKWNAHVKKQIVPTILMLERGDEHVVVEAMKQGAQDYLVKSSLNAETLGRSVRFIEERLQFIEQLENKQRYQQLLAEIAFRTQQSLSLENILQTAITEVLTLLQTDRVLIYRIWDNGSGTALAEAVGPDYPRVRGVTLSEEVFPKAWYPFYCKGNVHASDDVNDGVMSPNLIELFKVWQVQSRLAVPILQNAPQGNVLWGLLITHQCRSLRHWEAWEIELMKQLAIQLAISIQQAVMCEQMTLINTELDHISQLKDEFLANISHELRTPLNVILGQSEILQDEILGALNEKQKRSVQEIERSGQHLLELINDILDFSQMESNQVKLKLTSVAVNALCLSSLNHVRQQAQLKNIQLIAQVDSGLQTITVDLPRIRQVLVNLLSNAIKFTPKGGTVKLTAHQEQARDQQFLCFQVIDTGIGIAAEQMHKLFQPFTQIDGSLRRQYEGTGLGLSLVRQIVELHQGSLSVTSEVDRGSCFKVYLPYPHGSNSILTSSS